MMTPNKTRFLVTAALTATALLGGSMVLSACGKLGTLEQAPPMFGKAKADWSTSKDSNGGITTTTSSSASRDSERALPEATDTNKMSDPYRGNKKISDAPLEGFGNAESH